MCEGNMLRNQHIVCWDTEKNIKKKRKKQETSVEMRGHAKCTGLIYVLDETE